MKANTFVTAAVAGMLSVVAADWAAAQREEPRRDPPMPVRAEIPAGGLTFNFSDIDRNNDGNISVEEWNAFVASLQSRVGQKAGGAAAGGTRVDRQPRTGADKQPLPTTVK
jgi:hypothetical protein